MSSVGELMVDRSNNNRDSVATAWRTGWWNEKRNEREANRKTGGSQAGG
jgi:hypothetical protein